MLWLDPMRQDLRFGVRNLAGTPGHTAVAVVSLGLGIMAVTAMYSVIYGVVLHPFPYRDVGSLMSVRVSDPDRPGGRMYYSPDQFLEIAGRSTIFSGVIASTIDDVLWTGDGEPQRLRGNHITFNTFEVLGAPPLVGRTVTPADSDPAAEPVVVLGYRFWQRQFGGDPGVLGRRLNLDGRIRTVVGVMPKRFMWRGADVYVPVVYQRGRVVEGVRLVHVLGRLKPGVTSAQAEADLRPIIEELQRREPAQFPKRFRVGLVSFAETFPSGIREALWILFGAVGLLLLIACANVSNLLLSKATSRRREMAVRASLGADRGRLIRQLLTESLLLALAGCALGVLLAFPGLRAVLALVPPDTIPDESEVVISLPVLLFTLAVGALTALLFGLAPALQTGATDYANPLRESSRGLTGGRRSSLVRGGLVAAEVALSLVLLVAASLMIRTLLAMYRVPLGFRPDRLLTMRVPLSEKRYPDAGRRVAFFEELLRRTRAVPGVVEAGVNTGLHPLGNWGMAVEVAGSATPDTRPVLVHQISPGYLRTLGIPLLAGRAFTEAESATRQHVALVNQAFVRRRLAGTGPLGVLLRVPRLREAPFGLADDSLQVIGVVQDTLNRDLTNEIQPELYLPYTLAGAADRLVVLTEGDPAALAGAIRKEVYGVDKDQPVMQVRSMETILNEWVYAGPRFNLVLFGVFAGLGLALAVIGVYGVMSHAVAQQTQEIGVRIALGARSLDIAAMVLGRALRLLGVGIAAGLAGGLGGAHLLRRQIWNVAPLDLWSFVGVAALLLAAGLLASWRPARRAARVDPMTALRYE